MPRLWYEKENKNWKIYVCSVHILNWCKVEHLMPWNIMGWQIWKQKCACGSTVMKGEFGQEYMEAVSLEDITLDTIFAPKLKVCSVQHFKLYILKVTIFFLWWYNFLSWFEALIYNLTNEIAVLLCVAIVTKQWLIMWTENDHVHAFFWRENGWTENCPEQETLGQSTEDEPENT